VLSFATLASTSCDTNFDGQITVDAATTGFGVATNYVFDWTSNPAGTIITDATNASPGIFRSEAIGGIAGEKIGPGLYNITVTNNTNACTTNGSVIQSLSKWSVRPATRSLIVQLPMVP
jgi:hypothetical protein